MCHSLFTRTTHIRQASSYSEFLKSVYLILFMFIIKIFKCPDIKCLDIYMSMSRSLKCLHIACNCQLWLAIACYGLIGLLWLAIATGICNMYRPGQTN